MLRQSAELPHVTITPLSTFFPSYVACNVDSGVNPTWIVGLLAIIDPKFIKARFSPCLWLFLMFFLEADG